MAYRNTGFCRNRGYWLALLLLIAGLMGMGIYIQFVLLIEPCPLCILQRLAYLAVGGFAVLGLVWAPQRKRLSQLTALTAIPALAGLGVAIRQVWLQHNPPKVSACGADMSYLLDTLPVDEVLVKVFRGTGDCSERAWEFLSLSIAEWSVLCFSAILLSLWLHRRWQLRRA